MAQTKEGAKKALAAKLGLSVESYERRVSQGLKYCMQLSHWVKRSFFGKDISRSDGLASRCTPCRRSYSKARYTPVPKQLRKPMGPPPFPPRDGDKKQARQRINVEVREGRRPHPNKLPCADCGHRWKPGERRHEYDHHRGYDAIHHFSVQAVCQPCHSKRTVARGENHTGPRRDMARFGFAKLYVKHTTYEIEALTGVPAETVRRWLTSQGVTLRIRGSKPNGR